MWKSARMYFQMWGNWFWVFFVGESASVVGLAQPFAWATGVPTLVWWAIILAGFLLAPIVAFHRLRMLMEGNLADVERRLEATEARVRTRNLRIQFGEFLGRGRDLLNKKITKDERGGWIHDCINWRNEVANFIKKERPESVHLFLDVDRSAKDVIGSLDSEHRDWVLGMDSYCKNLKSFLRD